MKTLNDTDRRGLQALRWVYNDGGRCWRGRRRVPGYFQRGAL